MENEVIKIANEVEGLIGGPRAELFQSCVLRLPGDLNDPPDASLRRK